MTTEDLVMMDAESVVDLWESSVVLERKEIMVSSAMLFRALDRLAESVKTLRRERS